MTKTCNKCGEEKLLGGFYKSKDCKYGVAGTCKDCVNARSRKKYQNNKERKAETNRLWWQRNGRLLDKSRDRRIYFNDYRKKRRADDPEFRMLCSLRARLSNTLNGANKADTTKNLLGCTTEELKAHLESQFTDGMSWDNYGTHGWHIDHIIPCSSFDMLDPDQQRECFHYTNLQPLWAEDNLRKSDKIEKSC